MRGRFSSCAAAQAFSVCTSTPATASTTTSAPSATRMRRARVAEEVAEARRVDQVDFGLVPLGVGEAGRQRVLPGDLFFVVVGDGVALVHLPEAVHHAGGKEQRRNQLSLAASSVSDDSDIPDVGGLVDLHSGILPARVIRTLQGASYLAPSALATAANLRFAGRPASPREGALVRRRPERPRRMAAREAICRAAVGRAPLRARRLLARPPERRSREACPARTAACAALATRIAALRSDRGATRARRGRRRRRCRPRPRSRARARTTTTGARPGSRRPG